LVIEKYQMTDFIKLTCPTCGGKLQITPDVNRFSCGYCGNEHIVKQAGNVVIVEPVAAQLKEMKRGVDKTASELAINRLIKEIAELKQERDNGLRFFEDKKKALTTPTLPYSASCLDYFLIIGGILLCAIWGLLHKTISPITWILILGIAMVLIAIIKVSIQDKSLQRSNKQYREKANKELKELDESTTSVIRTIDMKISVKETELRRHQSIVGNSYPQKEY